MSENNGMPTYEEVVRGKRAKRSKWLLMIEAIREGEVTEIDPGGVSTESARVQVSHAARRAGIRINTTIINGRLYVARLMPEDVRK